MTTVRTLEEILADPCPITCPNCRKTAGLNKREMRDLRADGLKHITCHRCGQAYRIQVVPSYIVDKEGRKEP